MRRKTGVHVLVIRHAIAEDKERFAATGQSDDKRPLTEEGRAKMRLAASGLRVTAPLPALIATSPLVRARQTAEIVASALGVARVENVDALRPERSYDDLLAWLAKRASGEKLETVAIVGHEPHLGGLVTWLMTGFTESRVELKKGAACLLAFEGTPRPAEARMHWSLTPSHLRRLGD